MIDIIFVPGKGRGTVAKQDIQLGTVIEVSPVCIVSSIDMNIVSQANFYRYLFVNPVEYDNEKQRTSGYIVFGKASLCNHSDMPNAHIDWFENDLGTWARLVAIKAIQQGEEITLYYTNIDEYSDGDAFS